MTPLEQAIRCVGYVTLAVLFLSSCADTTARLPKDETQKWDWGVPEHFPVPKVPDDNPMTEAKFQLGRHLFYDTRLSYNDTISCASCHHQAYGFGDNVSVSIGASGDIGERNALPLVNVAYASHLNWANPLITSIEAQVQGPMYGDHPLELGTPEISILRKRLLDADDANYRTMFARAFPEESEATLVTEKTIIYALATFVRGLISYSSPMDAYLAGDRNALSPAAKRGFSMFNSERFECYHCHGGVLFTASFTHEGLVEPAKAFQNDGLYNIDEKGAYPWPNRGVYEVTGNPKDMGFFRAPTLRNTAVTGPYMHDGTVADLDELLDIYARGGRLISDGPNAGDGAQSPFRSPFNPGFILTDDERADFHAFFDALTDETFLTNPRFASPFTTTSDEIP